MAALLAPAPASAEPSSLASKQAQAERVLEQVRELDSSLARAVDAYNLATVRLGRVERDLEANRRRLALAKRGLRRAQSALSARAVALYTSSEPQSTLEVLLGATSLNDLVNRIETVDRVSRHDARVLAEIVAFRAEARRRAAALRKARAQQARVVGERRSHRASIERQLGERQALLLSIRSEIVRLQAAERARQRAVAARARARLAAAERQARQRRLAQTLTDELEEVVAPPAPAEEPPAEPVEQQEVESEAAPVEEVEEIAVEEVEEIEVSVEPPAPPAPAHGGVVGIAMQYLGTPYQWGGADPSTGFDCSGFIMYVYAQVGVSLPHNAAAQYGVGSPVSREDLQPGDLVFFDGLGHNGIYIGGDQFIHSPHTGDVVKISGMSEDWYASTYVGARRI